MATASAGTATAITALRVTATRPATRIPTRCAAAPGPTASTAPPRGAAIAEATLVISGASASSTASTATPTWPPRPGAGLTRTGAAVDPRDAGTIIRSRPV